MTLIIFNYQQRRKFKHFLKNLIFFKKQSKELTNSLKL